jgi:hypothetical protein
MSRGGGRNVLKSDGASRAIHITRGIIALVPQNIDAQYRVENEESAVSRRRSGRSQGRERRRKNEEQAREDIDALRRRPEAIMARRGESAALDHCRFAFVFRVVDGNTARPAAGLGEKSPHRGGEKRSLDGFLRNLAGRNSGVVGESGAISCEPVS